MKQLTKRRITRLLALLGVLLMLNTVLAIFVFAAPEDETPAGSTTDTTGDATGTGTDTTGTETSGTDGTGEGTGEGEGGEEVPPEEVEYNPDASDKPGLLYLDKYSKTELDALLVKYDASVETAKADKTGKTEPEYATLFEYMRYKNDIRGEGVDARCYGPKFSAEDVAFLSNPDEVDHPLKPVPFPDKGATIFSKAYETYLLDLRGRYANEQTHLKYMNEMANQDNLALYVDRTFGEFAVKNKDTGELYFSSPYNYRNVSVAGDVKRMEIASLLHLEYYDSSNTKREMDSFVEAVERGQVTYDQIENGVRITMEMGKKELSILAPYASEASRFEEKILRPMEENRKSVEEKFGKDSLQWKEADRAVRTIETYYTKTVFSELSADAQSEYLKFYSGLKKHDFYILRASMEKERLKLENYIKVYGGGLYKLADLIADDDLSGFIPKNQSRAVFKIPVEVTLDHGDVKISVIAEEIAYDTTEFVLTRVRVAQFFGAGRRENSGYLFVPDGSGAVINFNTEKLKLPQNFQGTVYGEDYGTTITRMYASMMQTVQMPVFGMREVYTKSVTNLDGRPLDANGAIIPADSTQKAATVSGVRGYLAIIEEGDAAARIYSESGGFTSPYETVYTDFSYGAVQRFSYVGGSKAGGDWTYQNRNYTTGNFTIRYRLLSGDKADYNGMAASYREYLEKTGVFTELVAPKKPDSPLYLEVLGLMDKRDSFFGIPYDRKVPMTTFDQSIDMMEELARGGVNNISLRYRGWMNGGLNYGVPNKLKVEKKLGGEKGFNKLVNFVQDNKYSLFPEVDFAVVRRDGMFDGYSTMNNAPKTMDKQVLTVIPAAEKHNILYAYNDYYAVSPKASVGYFNKFFSQFKNFNVGGVSIGTAGTMLYSDFALNANKANRQQAMEIMKGNLEKNGNNMGDLLVERGNAFTYKYATDIVDIPVTNSGFLTEDLSIPFMQMVLHGYKQYATKSVNLGDDVTSALLQCAEVGANLHFTLGYRNTDELRDTPYSLFYTVDYDTWKKDAMTAYAKLNANMASLQSKRITRHEIVEVAGIDTLREGNVTRTTYDDGTAVLVNYTKAKVTVDGVEIPGRDFVVIKKGDAA